MNINVTLPDELVEYVETKLADGVYASSSEMVGDALRMMQRVETSDTSHLEFLRSAYRIGLEGGDPQEADFSALKTEGRRRLADLKS